MVSCVTPYSADGMHSLIWNTFYLLWDNLALHFFLWKMITCPVIFLRRFLLSDRGEWAWEDHAAPVTQLLEQPHYCSSHIHVNYWQWGMKTQSTQTASAGFPSTIKKIFSNKKLVQLLLFEKWISLQIFVSFCQIFAKLDISDPLPGLWDKRQKHPVQRNISSVRVWIILLCCKVFQSSF